MFALAAFNSARKRCGPVDCREAGSVLKVILGCGHFVRVSTSSPNENEKKETERKVRCAFETSSFFVFSFFFSIVGGLTSGCGVNGERWHRNIYMFLLLVRN